MVRRLTYLIFISLFAYCLLPTPNSFSWGFYGHKRINKMAVFTLPPEMIGFFKKHIDFISEHAVDPDKRRYASEFEAPRHYIDLDHYGQNPFDSLPKFWKAAVAKYSEDTLNAHGIVPWWVDKMLYKLTDAFKNQNAELILHYAADIGHYIADAHVPLHTTKNYNGQFTGQKGIHAFWESRVPELLADNYDYFTGQAKYIEKPLDAIWKAVKESFYAKDSVLLFEAELNKSFPADKKYAYENRGNSTVKVYSEEYTKAYDKMLNGMVERRMRESIRMVGSLWYTAWVNAGQPDLSKIETREFSDSVKKAHEEMELMWKTGKPKNGHGHED
ncbi:MAG: zinc dependent phospholipase C family protein [Bacteroidota bacterium]